MKSQSAWDIQSHSLHVKAWQDAQDLDCKSRKGMLVHCSSIPNIPSPKSRRLFLPQGLVRRLNLLLCQGWCQYIENKPENAGRKTWHNDFLFLSLKKTWIEENADYLIPVYAHCSVLKSLAEYLCSDWSNDISLSSHRVPDASWDATVLQPPYLGWGRSQPPEVRRT